MNNEIKLGITTADKIFLIAIPPILGGLIGWFAPIIASWLSKIPFIPYVDLIKWLSTLSSPLVTWITLCIGVIAGIVFTVYAFSEILSIELNDDHVKTSIKNREEYFDKEQLEAIFMDDKRLVFLKNNGQEIFREKPEIKKEIIQTAFENYQYPWKDQDPYYDQYVRWVDNHPEFEPQINALLAARETALEKKKGEKAADLRKELAVLDVVIRDENDKQFVRMEKG